MSLLTSNGNTNNGLDISHNESEPSNSLNTCSKCNTNNGLDISHNRENISSNKMNHSSITIEPLSDTVTDTDINSINTDIMDDKENKTVSPDSSFIVSPEKELKSEHNAIIEDWRALKELSFEGSKCLLVPYTVDHVPTYNKWLNDPLIQQMTQTEPYSLDQEYEYQKEWKLDETKYIFIVLDKELNNAMCGDINIFITQNELHEHIGELNIMIAEHKSRRKGIATQVLQLIIKFARKYLEIKTFIAKISYDNHSSITLFKKIGFVQTDFINAFKEYTFTLTFDEQYISNNDINNDTNQKLKYKNDKLYTD